MRFIFDRLSKISPEEVEKEKVPPAFVPTCLFCTKRHLGECSNPKFPGQNNPDEANANSGETTSA